MSDTPTSGTFFSVSVPSWMKAISLFGIPGVIALYFVWMNGQILPQLQQQIILNRAESQKVQDMLRDHLVQQQDYYRLMMRICTNTAKTSQERQSCFDAR